jgi:hypothetical protein
LVIDAINWLLKTVSYVADDLDCYWLVLMVVNLQAVSDGPDGLFSEDFYLFELVY